MKKKNGYVYIKAHSHPRKNGHGYVMEHRLNAEKVIGRYLTAIEVIHHINEIKHDNRPENLYLFESNAKHASYHIGARHGHYKLITESNLKNYVR